MLYNVYVEIILFIELEIVNKYPLNDDEYILLQYKSVPVIEPVQIIELLLLFFPTFNG